MVSAVSRGSLVPGGDAMPTAQVKQKIVLLVIAPMKDSRAARRATPLAERRRYRRHYG